MTKNKDILAGILDALSEEFGIDVSTVRKLKRSLSVPTNKQLANKVAKLEGELKKLEETKAEKPKITAKAKAAKATKPKAKKPLALPAPPLSLNQYGHN